MSAQHAPRLKAHQMPNTFKRPFYASIDGKNLLNSFGAMRRFQTEAAALQAARFEVARAIAKATGSAS